jgi:hypothetical protein
VFIRGFEVDDVDSFAFWNELQEIQRKLEAPVAIHGDDPKRISSEKKHQLMAFAYLERKTAPETVRTQTQCMNADFAKCRIPALNGPGSITRGKGLDISYLVQFSRHFPSPTL